MLRRLIAAIVMTLGMPACAEGVHCWVRCHHPPDIKSAYDVSSVLRQRPNPPLSFIARSSGVVTTYLGKMLGIQGWRDYHLPARVNAKVVQAAGSTDLFYTIDLKIESLTVGGEDVRTPEGGSFIRVEVLPRVRVGARLPVQPDQSVCISGKLMWDADGFLEIHPNTAKQIEVCSCH